MKKIFYLVAIALIAASTFACGGGEDAGSIAYSRVINGILTNGGGQPIGKALITVEDANDDSDEDSIHMQAVTQKNGKFSFRENLAGPDINFLVAEQGFPEVRVSALIREGSESKIGVNIKKAGEVINLEQGVDAQLIPSDNCAHIFLPDSDLRQIAFAEEQCFVAASAVVSGTNADNIVITAIAESCPIEIFCPDDEVATVEQGLIFNLPTGVNGDFCDYRVEYRNKDNELLQSVKLFSLGFRMAKCRR